MEVGALLTCGSGIKLHHEQIINQYLTGKFQTLTCCTKKSLVRRHVIDNHLFPIPHDCLFLHIKIKKEAGTINSHMSLRGPLPCVYIAHLALFQTVFKNKKHWVEVCSSAKGLHLICEKLILAIIWHTETFFIKVLIITAHASKVPRLCICIRWYSDSQSVCIEQQRLNNGQALAGKQVLAVSINECNNLPG